MVQRQSVRMYSLLSRNKHSLFEKKREKLTIKFIQL